MDAVTMFCGPLGAVILIGITTFVFLVWYSIYKQSYWKKKGILYLKPLPLFGSTLEIMYKPQHEVEQKRYLELGAIYGHYEGNRPVLSVADPKLLRDIMVKDFQYFTNRRTFSANNEVVDNMMPNLESDHWKRVRAIITPTFSTGKLKRMMGIFKECSMTLVENFRNAAENKKPILVKRLFGTMSMDVIASSAFSTKLDSYNDPDNNFVKVARTAFKLSANWRFVMLFLAPKFMKFFSISVFPPNVMNFFKEVTLEIIEERRRLNQTRNDFLQLLIDTAKEVEKGGKWYSDEKDDNLVQNYGEEVADQKVFINRVTKSLSMDEIVSNCVIFFLAGYDTVATTLNFVAYLLACNPDEQEKARQEIRKCLKEAKGQVTYEAIQNMKYLDNVISETLRHYPPSNRLERRTETDYKLGDTGITIPKGMIVTIPIYAIHKDSKYFPDPEKFDPDRFTSEERSKRDPYVYMPFGAGPRNCIGMRFALLEIKVCLMYVINYFNIKACSKTEIPLKFHTGLAILQPHDVYLEMEPRNDGVLIK